FPDLLIYVNEKDCCLFELKKPFFGLYFINIHLHSKENHHLSDNQTRFLLCFHKSPLHLQSIEDFLLLQGGHRYELHSQSTHLWLQAREHHLNKMQVLKSNTYSKLYNIWLFTKSTPDTKSDAFAESKNLPKTKLSVFDFKFSNFGANVSKKM